ncbi:MAG: GTP-binding protein, partial [Desulfobacteraceae bacterium]|nr:GTP-binding protein [Desulfobacteraceae bacterium]
MTKLDTLDLDDNKALTSPPPEVVKQGTKAILAYLRERLEKSEKQWVSKMILVGEGGVGKTQLLRALQGKEFQVESETTHGIGIEPLTLRHPEEPGVQMSLNCWDFGGQEIYHATHQFFLTKRSLFVLVWDTRQGWEAGKLHKWLDAIEARAPGSPVLLVATKIDERDADLPLGDLRKKYPQMLGHYEVSNKTRKGIKKLKDKLAHVAAELPLMGEEWPATWLEAANAIRNRTEQYISPKEFYRVTSRHKVRKKDSDILAQWMHDLGDILYFRDNEELNDLVILDPAWMNEKISRVLESKEVIKKDGIFTHVHMEKLWGDIEDDSIRQHLMRLMEQFDLSYRTLRNREISLVVERLPLDPPNYRKTWEAIQNIRECKEISMKFSVGSLQAGLPTWFIARSHRFSIHKHWRMGALFADGKERRHLGLIEAYEYERYLRLTVRGPMPHNFFALLRDGLELTLARFPGLEIRRTVPCPGHDGQECKNEFDVEQLEGAFKENVTDIPCPETHFKKTVSVPEMLFGLHTEQYDPVLQRMEEMEARLAAGHEDILNVSVELKGLVQRGFTSLFNAQQGLEESHCPIVFAVLPKEGQSWLKNLLGQKMVMQLFCQAPGEW